MVDLGCEQETDKVIVLIHAFHELALPGPDNPRINT